MQRLARRQQVQHAYHYLYLFDGQGIVGVDRWRDDLGQCADGGLQLNVCAQLHRLLLLHLSGLRQQVTEFGQEFGADADYPRGQHVLMCFAVTRDAPGRANRDDTL